MLPTEARVCHLATICARHLHAYMSLGHVPGPGTCSGTLTLAGMHVKAVSFEGATEMCVTV
jgi:hypothetical protein